MQAVPAVPARPRPPPGLNPRWNEVFPLQHPNHQGEPPSGQHVGFGDPGGRIGQLVSIESTLPAWLPQPHFSEQKGKRLVIAVVSGLVLTLLTQILYRKIIVGLQDAREFKLASLVASANPLVFVIGLLLAVGVYWLTGLLFKKVPDGTTVTCTMVGTEGMAIFTRTPEADDAQIVPFEGVVVSNREEEDTMVIKDQFGNVKSKTTTRTVSRFWRDEAGQLVYQHQWRGQSGDMPSLLLFLGEAERAQRRHRLARKLPLLEGPGLRFAFADSPDFLHLQRHRVDVSVGGQQYSVPPSQIGATALNRATLLRLPSGQLELTPERMPELPLLTAALQKLGVAPA